MGWFWTDNISTQAKAPHPLPRGNVSPPPECPMHNSSPTSRPPPTPSKPEACPYVPPETNTPDSKPPGSSSPSYISKLNPLNYMPSNLSNTRDSPTQTVSLPLERESSSIPRGDGEGNWEYPSPQQMYNAMLRKGYNDTPAEHVEAMVAVHNFLNEGAWEEIKEWERRFSGGLSRGWAISKQGEEGAARQANLDATRRARRGEPDASGEPKLLHFMGRPNDPTPKARMLSFMAWLHPTAFADNPPFDRHDWYVQRQSPGNVTQGEAAGKKVRYVIDYYSGPPEPTGEPVFYLDVRPAVDGPTAACERILRWGGDVWYRASGGSVREEAQKAKR